MRCTVVYVSRTNIDIDEDLVSRVMQRFDLRTKREAVDFALREVADDPMTREEFLAMEGSGWAGDLDAMRGADPVKEW